jgi:CheY-like chemotaxis protein
MNRVLLVDNDLEWLGSMYRALPGYDVDKAQSYDDAVDLLDRGPAYDVAVVDLNLIDSGDGLGGDILSRLRRDHPRTRRIALTAWPPGAVRKEIFGRYDVDELLLKAHMSLSLLRQVVQMALARTADDISSDVKALRSERWEDFRAWRDRKEGLLAQHMRTVENDRRDISYMRDRSGHAAEKLAALDAELADLKTRRDVLGRACSRLEAMLRDISGPEDVSLVSGEIADLKEEFGA